MNRKSCIRSFKSGKKITHVFFQDNEFIQLKKGRIVDENGINIGSLESFIEGTDMAFPNDWREYKI